MNSTLKTFTSSNSNEWYTPPDIIERARATMGCIDLDPASNEYAQTWIKANRYYTIADNALTQSWKAHTIWLNPPYGALGHQFCDRLLAGWIAGDFGQATVLVRGDSKALESLFDYAYHCRSKRIKFLPSPELLAEKLAVDPRWSNSPVMGSTIFYFGDRVTDFITQFKDQGKLFPPALKGAV